MKRKAWAIGCVLIGFFFTFFHFGYVAGSNKWRNETELSIIQIFFSFAPVFVGLYLVRSTAS